MFGSKCNPFNVVEATPFKRDIMKELAVEQEKSRFHIALRDQQETVVVLSTGGYGNYVKKSLGTMRIDQAGKHTLRIKPEKGHWQPINLRQLELKRR